MAINKSIKIFNLLEYIIQNYTQCRGQSIYAASFKTFD